MTSATTTTTTTTAAVPAATAQWCPCHVKSWHQRQTQMLYPQNHF